MSKQKKAGHKKNEVGKAGSPPSGTKNEMPVRGKTNKPGIPKKSKKDVGAGRGGGQLH